MQIEEKRFKEMVDEKYKITLIHVFSDGLKYGRFKIINPVERILLSKVYELAFKMGVLEPIYMA